MLVYGIIKIGSEYNDNWEQPSGAIVAIGTASTDREAVHKYCELLNDTFDGPEMYGEHDDEPIPRYKVISFEIDT